MFTLTTCWPEPFLSPREHSLHLWTHLLFLHRIHWATTRGQGPGISPVNTFMVWRRRSPDTPRADVCTRSFLPVILDSLKVSLLPPLLSSGTCIRFPRYDTFFLGLMGENSRSFRWTKSLSKMVQSSCRAQSLEQKTYSPSFLILPSNHRCHELKHFNCDNTCK